MILYTKGLEHSARSLEQRWQIPTPFLVSSAGDRLSRSSPLSSNPFTTTRRSQPLSTHVQTSTDSRRFFFGVLPQPRRRRFSPPQTRRPIARDTRRRGCACPRFAYRKGSGASLLPAIAHDRARTPSRSHRFRPDRLNYRSARLFIHA